VKPTLHLGERRTVVCENRSAAGRERGLRHLQIATMTVILLGAFGVRGLCTLDLGPPEYGGCGVVTINGYVDTAPPAESLTWDWGDGTLSQSWFPASHRYAANGTYTVTVAASPTGETEHATVVLTDAGDPTCSYRVNVTPTWVLLRDGATTEALDVEIRDAEGGVLSNEEFEIAFTSDNPGVVSVDQSGVVSSTGFGRAWVTVVVGGIASQGKARVVAGRFWIEPAVVCLALEEGEDTAFVAAFAESADGSPVGTAVSYVGGNEVASVEALSGLVTGLSLPTPAGGDPYVSGTVAGWMTDNAAYVCVTADDLNLNPVRHAGENVELWTPSSVCTSPFGQLAVDLQAVQVLDGIYALERWLTDVVPFNGERQRLVLDPGIDADGTVPCGLSGNPIRLGMGTDNCRSCFGGDDWLQWGIMAHEMGHNFMAQEAFSQFCGFLRDGGFTYSEGLASMLGIYAIDEMLEHPETYELLPGTVENLSRSWIPLTPGFSRTAFYEALQAYEASPDYDSFTADHLDAILTQLHDEFGETFFYRLLSVFFPPHSGLSVSLSTEAEALSFWVAACSAAAGTDLFERFSARWGFPLDEAFYQEILADVRALVAQRGPADPAPEDTAACFRVNTLGQVFADGAAYGPTFKAGAADVAEWAPVSERGEPGDVLELDATHPGSYRLTQTPCSSAVAGVVSTEPGVVLGGAGSEGTALLALSGIVPVKVTNEGGPIQPGDLLVSSSTPGYAMRWVGPEPCPCALVGKALEPMTDERGVISVLLTAH
jgi:hypothetical protein